MQAYSTSTSTPTLTSWKDPISGEEIDFFDRGIVSNNEQLLRCQKYIERQINNTKVEGGPALSVTNVILPEFDLKTLEKLKLTNLTTEKVNGIRATMMANIAPTKKFTSHAFLGQVRLLCYDLLLMIVTDEDLRDAGVSRTEFYFTLLYAKDIKNGTQVLVTEKIRFINTLIQELLAQCFSNDIIGEHYRCSGIALLAKLNSKFATQGSRKEALLLKKVNQGLERMDVNQLAQTIWPYVLQFPKLEVAFQQQLLLLIPNKNYKEFLRALGFHTDIVPSIEKVSLDRMINTVSSFLQGIVAEEREEEVTFGENFFMSSKVIHSKKKKNHKAQKVQSEENESDDSSQSWFLKKEEKTAHLTEISLVLKQQII